MGFDVPLPFPFCWGGRRRRRKREGGAMEQRVSNRPVYKTQEYQNTGCRKNEIFSLFTLNAV